MIALPFAPVTSSPNPPTPPSRRRQEGWLFAGLILIHLLPIWLVPFVSTQDGPAHLSMAHALREIGEPDEPDGGWLGETFQHNREAIPNRFVFTLLADVLGFLPLPLAEQVLLSAYVVLLPLAARYALRSIRPQSGFLAVLMFPFTYNLLLNLGFYNFCFSLAAFLFALGFWLRHGGRLGILRTLALTLLVLWTYFCHPVTLGVLVGTLLTLASWRTLLDLRKGKGFRSLGWLAGPIAASAPAVVLLLSFFQERMAGRVSDMTLAAKARQLASLYSLVSLDSRLVALSLALVALLAALAVVALKRRSLRRRLLPGDGLLLVVLLLVGVYFVAPNEMGQGGFVTHRLNLFPFMVLILWLGTVSFPPQLRTSIQAAGAAISMALVALMLGMWASLGAHMADILTAIPHVEPRSGLLTLSFSNAGEEADGRRLAFRTWPFVHAGSHIAARVPLVDLSLYEAHESYFPLTYRPERNPFLLLARDPLDLEAEPPRVDLSRYPVPIDYVLLVWPGALPLENPAARSIRRQLAAGYERIHTSPEGLAELYRRRDFVTTGTRALPAAR